MTGSTESIKMVFNGKWLGVRFLSYCCLVMLLPGRSCKWRLEIYGIVDVNEQTHRRITFGGTKYNFIIVIKRFC